LAQLNGDPKVVDAFVVLGAVLLLPLVVALGVSLVYRVARGKWLQFAPFVRATVLLSTLAFVLLRLVGYWTFFTGLPSSDIVILDWLTVGAGLGSAGLLLTSQLARRNGATSRTT